jgi:hypothetical protein
MYVDSGIDLMSERYKRLDVNSMSKGNQQKYYDTVENRYIKLPFYFQGVHWKDYMVERLSTILSESMNTLGVEILTQKIIKTTDGCAVASKDFCSETNSEWISFNRFSNTDINKSYGLSYKVYSSILNEYKELNVDAENYIIVMIVMDYLLLNEDRHTNNFGVLRKEDSFAVAPLFDFGLGLFEHDKIYNGKTLNEALSLVECKPFNKVFDSAISMLYNIGKSDTIKKIIKDLEKPDKSLFPNDLGYEYFNYAVDHLWEMIKQ